MTEPVEKPLDMKMVWAVAKDLLVSAGVGGAAALGAVAFVRSRVPDAFEQYSDFLTFIETMVWITVGGIVYAVILHLRAKRTPVATGDDGGKAGDPTL